MGGGGNAPERHAFEVRRAEVALPEKRLGQRREAARIKDSGGPPP